MTRGELYQVYKLSGDPKQHPKPYRTFVIVSRQALIDSKFSTVVCAPVFSAGEGLSTQVEVGPEEGLKQAGWVFCDDLQCLRKATLTHYVGTLSESKMERLNQALELALGLN
jgi:mRNA interferase MazF